MNSLFWKMSATWLHQSKLCLYISLLEQPDEFVQVAWKQDEPNLDAGGNRMKSIQLLGNQKKVIW